MLWSSGDQIWLKWIQIILKAEEELKGAISLTSFTARQFRERVKVKDRLVSKALNRTKIMLIGDERNGTALSLIKSPEADPNDQKVQYCIFLLSKSKNSSTFNPKSPADVK